MCYITNYITNGFCTVSKGPFRLWQHAIALLNKILEDEHGNNEKHTRNLTHLPECDSKGRREVETE